MAISILRKVTLVMKVVPMKISQTRMSSPLDSKFSVSNSPSERMYWLRTALGNFRLKKF